VVDILKFLTQKKHCKQDIQNKKGELPLHIACRKGSIDVVKLVSDCNVNAQTINGNTPLHVACMHECVDVVIQRPDCLFTCDDILLQIVQGPDDLYNIRLQIACRECVVFKIVHFLTKQKECDLNIQNKEGELSLHLACKLGSASVVKLVSDCDVNAQTIDGNTPLHIACQQEYDGMQWTTLFFGHPDTFLQIAKCLIGLVQFLTQEKHCKQDIQNKKRELPLQIACKGSIDVVKLVSDCDVNAQTIDGDTPLHVACRHKCDSVVSYMTEVKLCNCSVQNKEEELPLHIACRLKCLKIVKLVDNCNIHTKTVSGKTPIHTAYEFNDLCHLSSFHNGDTEGRG